MNYSSAETADDEPPLTKFSYASWVAAAISHMSLRQRDAASLIVFDEKVRTVVPPSSGTNHYDEIIRQIEKVVPASATVPEKALVASANAITRRGLVILISDLLCDADEVMKALRVFKTSSADFADCLIERTAASAGCTKTMTFDIGAAKAAGMTLIE